MRPEAANPYMKRYKGFTLIELMVAAAIIGLISAIVLSSLSMARARTRDTTRLSDMRQLQTALETYKTERGVYPSTVVPPATQPSWLGTCSGFGSRATSGANGWIPNLAPTHIRVLPVDPKPITNNTCYVYRSNGTDYHLLAYQTVEILKGAANPAPRPAPNNTEASFSFSTPGARTW